METDKEAEDKNKAPAHRTTFAKNIILDIDDGAEIHLRRPNVKELNEFDKLSHPRGKKGLQVDKADPEGARVWLFDKIFIKAVKCRDDEGLIPEHAKERIPEDSKAYMILHFVQTQENIDVKN